MLTRLKRDLTKTRIFQKPKNPSRLKGFQGYETEKLSWSQKGESL